MKGRIKTKLRIYIYIYIYIHYYGKTLCSLEGPRFGKWVMVKRDVRGTETADMRYRNSKSFKINATK